MIRKLSPLNALYMAQFLSAFVDNMILFIVQAIIGRDHYPDYYLPFVQSTFLASYIVLSPWVGLFADARPKARVLILGNLVKAIGVLLLLFGCNPALSYAAVGLGAVIYSPAKYGILPILTTNEEQLLRANSALESYTILAILTGSIAGGFLSDFSITISLLVCVSLYGLSIVVNTLIPRDLGQREISYKHAVSRLLKDTLTLLSMRQSHYSLIGTGSFWLASAVLRMILFSWVPLTLGIVSGTSISLIIAITGVGIAIGAILAPHIIQIQTYERTAWFGLALSLGIAAFLVIHSLSLTVVFLLLVGVFGGIYVVPMNACLQQVGHATIGAGKTVAIQNFIENTFMFLGVSGYTWAAKSGAALSVSLGGCAVLMCLLSAYLWIFSLKNNKS